MARTKSHITHRLGGGGAHAAYVQEFVQCHSSLDMVHVGTLQIADFGVARIIECTGHMTAETGTYRWMAPEVIEHKPYDEKADVFSFAVVLWELLTCKVCVGPPACIMRVMPVCQALS